MAPNVDPHAEKAFASEQAALGSALISATAARAVAERLRSEDFTSKTHRSIFRAIRRLTTRGTPPDILTLPDEWEREKDVVETREQMTAYALQLADTVPTASHVDYYIRQVLRYSAYRVIVSEAQEMASKVAEGELDPEDIWARSTASVASRITFAIEGRSLEEVAFEMADEIEGGHLSPPLFTGLSDLDDLLGGTRPGQMGIVIADPNAGKSAFVFQQAVVAAKSGWGPTGLFSLEMSEQELVTRMIASASGIPPTWLMARGQIIGGRTVPFTDDQKAAIKRAVVGIAPVMRKLHVRECTKLEAIQAEATRLVQHVGCRLLIVDYAQLIDASASAEKGEGRVQALNRIWLGMRSMAKRLQVPLIVVAQVNREASKRRDELRMSDIEGSGQAEKDATWVLALNVMGTNQDGNALLKAVPVKSRFTAKGSGSVILEFIGRKFWFRVVAREATTNHQE